MKLNIYIPAEDKTTSGTPAECNFGDMPVVITEDNEHVKPGDYIPVTNNGRRCDRFNCDRNDELRKIMDDADEHPIVRHYAKEEYMRRLVRDYVPNTRAGETKEVKMAKILENAINDCGFYQDEMAKHFSQYAHRYLDNSLFGGFILNYIFIHALKYRNGRYDGRNEFACKACDAIVRKLDDEFGWEYYVERFKRESA